MARDVPVKIDSDNFDKMISKLSRKTGATYMKVLESMTGVILGNTARKTKTTNQKKIKESIASMMRRPLKTDDGHRIGITSAGLVWINLKSWRRDSWALVGTNGKLKQISGKTRKTSVLKIKEDFGKNKSLINSVIKEAKVYMKTQMEERKAKIGSGKRSWLEIAAKLKIPIRNQSGLAKALKAKITPNHKSSVDGRKSAAGQVSAIHIKSKSQTALNRKAGGMRAFERSLNGQVSQFKRMLQKDFRGYAQRFADANGFQVR